MLYNVHMTNKLPFTPIKKIGDLYFTSGQIHLTADGKLLEGTIKEQTRQVMEKEDLTFENVVKTTIYLTDMNNYSKVNEAYMEYFDEVFPAREAIGIKELPFGASIEISMIAGK